MKFLASCAVIAVSVAAPCLASDEVRYESAPAWVVAADLDAALANRQELILYDRQVLLDGGVVTRFTDLAYDIANVQAMQKFGTLQFGWLPDKGDLIIHRLEILRGRETIDLLAEGVKPEVIRRERQLEKRSVDGMLTAVISVPRLQVGDVLRVSASTTLSDQALQEQMQVSEGFIARPARVGFGRLRVLWPKDAGIHWGTIGQVALGEPVEQGGYRVLEAIMPIAEAKPMPDDAPGRFKVNPLVQVGSFADWRAVSAVMAPHYVTEGTIAPGSPVAQQVARIMASSADPLQRMAKALQLVQDEISYLANGMDGGNYLPQSPADTWSLRYGDCKAKTLLLLAMLREMGITAEAVLVNSSEGDTVAISQALPSAFDHVIVHATVDGTDYWLDGTSSGTRLDTMYEVPDFRWALPVVAGGSDLVQMAQRWPTVPDRTVRMTYDLSNGVDLPALYEVEVEAHGIMGARFRPLASETDRATIIGQAIKYFEDLLGGLAYDASYSYDEATGVGRLKAKGMVFDQFGYQQGVSTHTLGGASIGWTFAPDRARSAWRDIPYQVGGPYYIAEQTTYRLPKGQTRSELTGLASLDETVAGMRLHRTIKLDGDTMRLEDSAAYIPAQIAPADIAKERTAMARINSGAPELRLYDAKRHWELDDKEIARRIAPYVAAASSITDLRESAAPVYLLRANFYKLSRQYKLAVEDFDRSIEAGATVDAYAGRASAEYALGDKAAALADAQAAFDQQGDLATAASLATYMARNGQAPEALDFLDGLGLEGDDAADLANLWSELSGLAGRAEEGWDRLQVLRSEKPDNTGTSNALCWHAGIWSMNLAEAEPLCERAVKDSGASAATVDSRALVNYRLGRRQEALADLNAALSKEPAQAASLFLRGLIRTEDGEQEAGRLDLLHARRLDPSIDERYAGFGLRAK